MRLVLFDRRGGFVRELTDVLAAVRDEELNGGDSLELTTREPLSKGQRVVWRDASGAWHEHVVSSVEAGRGTCSAWCESSTCELRGDYVVDRRPGVGTGGCSAAEALAAALSASRWSVGEVDVAGAASASMYHESAWEAVSQVVGAWGGELRADIEVDPASGVTGRRLSLLARRGSSSPTRRFEYARGLAGVRRTVDDEDVITACWAWGRGEELDGGAYGRRVGIADVNGGVGYVEDEAATALFGRPDGEGGMAPAFGQYVDDQCEDPQELLEAARAYLDGHKEPLVSYEADVVQLGEAGADLKGVALGDAVQVVDRGFPGGGLRLEARAVGIKTDLLRPESPTVTLGNFLPSLTDSVASLRSGLRSLSDRSAAWDAVQRASAGYIDAVIASLNGLFETNGAYISVDTASGITVTDKPEAADSTLAVNLSSAGLRVADSKTSSGDWDWRSFVTGAGATLDEVVAGTLKAGRIQDVTGERYWDLDTGDLRMAGYATAAEAVGSVEVQYAVGESATEAPAGGWSASAPDRASGGYVWQRTVTTTADGASSAASAPACIQGGAGVTVASVEYAASASGDAAPEDGWQASVPAAAKGEWLWCRTSYSDGSSALTRSYAGTDGEDGASVAVESAAKSGGTTTVVLASTDGSRTTIEVEDGSDGATGAPGAAGADGRSSYTHLAWADSEDGSEGFSVSDSAGKLYLGVYEDGAEADSADPSDYSWTLIKGADGASVTVSSVRWAASSSGTEAPTTGWQASVPDVAQGEWLWCRTAYSDGTAADTCSYQGTDGEDGKSVSVRSVAKSGKVTTVTLASTDGATSTLSIADGEDGATGAEGAAGYVHVAWATSADGSTGFSTSDSSGKTYLGVYTDSTEADSTSYGDYSWSLIKGADGAKGDTGTGVSALEPQYYLSTSAAECAGGSWSAEQPAWADGRHIWTRTLVTWTDGTATCTAPVLAKAVDSANQAVADLDAALDQEGVFDRLTGGGKTQGIYLEDGLVYINGEYIKADTVSAAKLTKAGGGSYADVGDQDVGGYTRTGMRFYEADGTPVGLIAFIPSSAGDGTYCPLVCSANGTNGAYSWNTSIWAGSGDFGIKANDASTQGIDKCALTAGVSSGLTFLCGFKADETGQRAVRFKVDHNGVTWADMTNSTRVRVAADGQYGLRVSAYSQYDMSSDTPVQLFANRGGFGMTYGDNGVSIDLATGAVTHW